MNDPDRLPSIESLSAEIDRSLADLVSGLVDDPLEVGARTAELIELREAAEAAHLERLSATAHALEKAHRDLHSTNSIDEIVRLVCPAVAAISGAESVVFTALAGLSGTPLDTLGTDGAITPAEAIVLPQDFGESDIPRTFSCGANLVFLVDVDGRPAAAVHVAATLDSDTIGALSGYAEAVGFVLERAGLERRRSHQAGLLSVMMGPDPEHRSQRPDLPPSSIERRPNHETSCCQEILTNREAEILRLLLTGMSNAAIAAHLFVSVETVRTHVTSVLRKYRASNRAELIARHGHSDL